MNDLSDHEQTIDLVKASLAAIRYDRPTPAPRHRHPRRTAVIGIAVVVLVATWQVAGSPSEAWAESGRSPDAQEEAMLTERCREALGDGDPTAESGRLPSALVAAEVRGARASMVFADESGFVVCIFRAIDGDYRLEVVSWGTVQDLRDQVGPLQFDTLGVGRPTGGAGHQWVTGVAEQAVDRVTIETPSLGRFDATLANGWFTVWWPSGPDGFDVIAFDATGTELARAHFD